MGSVDLGRNDNGVRYGECVAAGGLWVLSVLFSDRVSSTGIYSTYMGMRVTFVGQRLLVSPTGNGSNRVCFLKGYAS